MLTDGEAIGYLADGTGVELPVDGGVLSQEVAPDCVSGAVVGSGDLEKFLVDLLEEFLIAVPWAVAHSYEHYSVFRTEICRMKKNQLITKPSKNVLISNKKMFTHLKKELFIIKIHFNNTGE